MRQVRFYGFAGPHCISHLGATMPTTLYDAIQRAASDVGREPRFLSKFGIGIILVHGRCVLTDSDLRKSKPCLLDTPEHTDELPPVMLG